MATRLIISHGMPPGDTPRRRERAAAQRAATMLLGRDAVISHTPDGAPYIDGYPGYVSISHTRNILVLALDDSHPVGVDVEYDAPRVARVTARVSTPDEAAVPPLQLWCLKEAVFKCALLPRATLPDIHADSPYSATLAGRRFAIRYLPLPGACIALAHETPFCQYR